MKLKLLTALCIFFLSIAVSQAKPKVVVYYFHHTTRCSSCLSIESYSRQIIETQYADLIKKGILEFKVLNEDLPENEKYVKDFSLDTQELVIVKNLKDDEIKWKTAEKVWELLDNFDNFKKYLVSEIDDYVNNA